MLAIGVHPPLHERGNVHEVPTTSGMIADYGVGLGRRRHRKPRRDRIRGEIAIHVTDGRARRLVGGPGDLGQEASARGWVDDETASREQGVHLPSEDLLEESTLRIGATLEILAEADGVLSAGVEVEGEPVTCVAGGLGGVGLGGGARSRATLAGSIKPAPDLAFEEGAIERRVRLVDFHPGAVGFACKAHDLPMQERLRAIPERLPLREKRLVRLTEAPLRDRGVLCPEGDDHLVGGADGYLSPIDRQDERHPASLAGDIYRKPNVEVVDAICEGDRAGHR